MVNGQKQEPSNKKLHNSNTYSNTKKQASVCTKRVTQSITSKCADGFTTQEYRLRDKLGGAHNDCGTDASKTMQGYRLENERGQTPQDWVGPSGVRETGEQKEETTDKDLTDTRRQSFEHTRKKARQLPLPTERGEATVQKSLVAQGPRQDDFQDLMPAA